MQVPNFGIVSEANCEQLMKALHIPLQAVPTDLDHTLNRVAQVCSNLVHCIRCNISMIQAFYQALQISVSVGKCI